MSDPRLTPEVLAEYYLAGAISKRALSRIRKTIPEWVPRKDYTFSRESALEMAKKLILVSSEDEAIKLLQSDQTGKLSFWKLATFLQGFLDDGGISAEGVAEQSLPYYLLCSWFLDRVEKVSGNWHKDTDPFSDQYPASSL